MSIPSTILLSLLPHTSAVVPEFDLALASADLVVAGRFERADSGGAIRVLEVLAGTPPKQLLPAADLSRFGVHYHVPQDGRTRLLFLHRLHKGWGVHQRPGLTPVWNAKTATNLRTLVRVLQDLRVVQTSAALAAHVRVATDLAQRDPLLGASALRALARRPTLLRRLGSAEQRTLSMLLADAGGHVAIRDHAARCLAGAGAVGLQAQLVAALTSGSATGLGPLFGRLLHGRLGDRCLSVLRDALPRCRPGGHEQILQAAWATQRQAARDWVRAVRRDPEVLRAGTGRKR